MDDLTPELKEKALACKTPEDLLALAKEQGYELSDEQLEAVAGGLRWSCDDHTNNCTDYPCAATVITML
ncbi:MAG: Nif11 family protein [Coriobacteriales bacterium]|nr:Nif11 family protein [Coriobacteriales bacterium]